MIKSIEQFFKQLSAHTPGEQEPLANSHLAAAALLVEVAAIDQHFAPDEWRQLRQSLCTQCGLSETEAAELIDEARQASANSTSLYDFTREINQHFQYEDKLQLMENLWRVAYADGNLDKYEEHIIRRIADLIYVSHGDFIRMKIVVRDGQSP